MLPLLVGTLLITTRLVAMVIIAPVLGARSVPFYVKAVLAVVVSLAIAPVVLSSTEHNLVASTNALDSLVTSLANEAVVGCLIGLGVLIIFSTALMIGSAVGQLSGLQLDSLAQNNEFGQQPAAQLIGITATVVFVLGGGLELLFATVIDSFQALPLGSSVASETYVTLLTTLLQQSFELTIRAVAPAIATLLISTVVVGILSRTLPQLNLIQLGLSSNMGLMMLALFLTLGGCVWLVIDDVERAAGYINDSIGGIR